MPTTVKPKISRIEFEFPASGNVRVRLYLRKVVEENGEDPVSVTVEPRDVAVAANVGPINGVLAWALVQAKTKFGRDDIEFDYPAT